MKYADLFRLDGKVALVTGSSRGIGAATAERLAADGASVVVNYVASEGKAQAVVDRIRQAGGTATAIQADMGDWGQAQALVAKAAEAFGRLDILVNNAGLNILDRSWAKLSAKGIEPDLNERGWIPVPAIS